jgi:hypothetical protein
LQIPPPPQGFLHGQTKRRFGDARAVAQAFLPDKTRFTSGSAFSTAFDDFGTSAELFISFIATRSNQF